MADNQECELSVIIPVFNEVDNITELCSEVAGVLDSLTSSWEIIIVDDGSNDGSWSLIENEYMADKRVRGLRLACNFGHQFALLAGMRHAGGKAVITMDGDFQHPPVLIAAMVQYWRDGYEIVQAKRKDNPATPLFKRLSSKWFYVLFSLLSGVRMKPGLADFRLLNRCCLKRLLQLGDSGLFWRGIVQLTGCKSCLIDYDAPARRHGRSKYSLLKMTNLAWTAITSFSIIPLRLAVVIGGLTSLMAFGELLYVLYVRLLTNAAVPGWASALSVISFLFGVLFILLGIVGEYVGRILVEVRGRPRYILSDALGLDGVGDHK